MSKVQNVNSTELSQKIESEGLVLVDFWAPWCNPCKLLAPILDEVSEGVDDKTKIIKINVDENRESAVEHGVRGIPTLILFKNGEPVATKVGAVTLNEVKDLIKNAK